METRKIFFWIAAIGLAISTFLIDSDIGKYLFMASSAILLYQAIKRKLPNLIFLNVFNLIGMTYSLFS